jgi:hypothetical protein
MFEMANLMLLLRRRCGVAAVPAYQARPDLSSCLAGTVHFAPPTNAANPPSGARHIFEAA